MIGICLLYSEVLPSLWLDILFQLVYQKLEGTLETWLA